MLQLLVQVLSSGRGRGRPAQAANVRRFTPGLEALGERANPSGGAASVAGEWFTGQVAVAADAGPAPPAPPAGSKAGSAGDGVSDAAAVAHGVWVGGPHGGRVSPFGGGTRVDPGSANHPIDPLGGGTRVDPGAANKSIDPQISRSSGEEIPQQ